jgi:LytS/YehU family sensor histidine kinase
LEFWVLFGVLKALIFYKKFHDKQLELISMENELNNAQLITLKKQLQPHFLFNTLNTVSALMDENVDQARKVLTKLAGLLRIILDRDQKIKITLRAEMEYVRSYLDIEHIRFSDRLKVEYNIAENTQEALVPSLILQPLVENAIQHGISQKTTGGSVIVSSKKTGDLLELNIIDNGPGIPDSEQVLNAPGIGIKNVKDRLLLMYPGVMRFQLLDQDGNGTLARIVIPFETIDKTLT